MYRRRDVLKSAALLGAPMLVSPASANSGLINFHFVVVGWISMAEPDRLVLAGEGALNHAQVIGHGSFTHFLLGINADTGLPGPPPFKIVGHGTWKAKRMVSFVTFGQYGSVVSGILEAGINLVPASGNVIRDVGLKVVCNIPPAGIATGLPEGIFLSIPGGPLFQPLPGGGNTAFTLHGETRD